MTFGELVDRVTAVTGLQGADAAKVAMEIHRDTIAVYDEDLILMAAEMLGLDVHPPGVHECAGCGEADPFQCECPKRTVEQQLDDAMRIMCLETDPARVMSAVYRECPRCPPAREDGTVRMPVIGRVPKDSVFHSEELDALLEQLPENLRLLIGNIDVHRGELHITLYDEANDVDRTIGPIDLAQFGGPEDFDRAIQTLLKRIPRVLASDFN